jgi:hypothetical protein
MCRQGNEYRTNVPADVHANRTLTVPPLQAVSGSYRMRHLYASARSPEGAAAMQLTLDAVASAQLVFDYEPHPAKKP